CHALILTALYLLSPCGLCIFLFSSHAAHPDLHSFPTRRSSDLRGRLPDHRGVRRRCLAAQPPDASHPRSAGADRRQGDRQRRGRSEEHTSELQSHLNLVCRLLLEKKKTK